MAIIFSLVKTTHKPQPATQKRDILSTALCAMALSACFFASGCVLTSSTAVASKPAAGHAANDFVSQRTRPGVQQKAAPRQTVDSTGKDQSVRTGAMYRQATVAYRAHRFSDALNLIDKLAATSGVTMEDKSFLLRQKQICQAAITGKSPRVAPGQVAGNSVSNSRESNRMNPSSVQRDCGPRALLLLCRAQHVSATLPSLIKAAHTGTEGTSMDGLASAAQSVGFHSEGMQMDKDALEHLSRPAIAWVDGNHYVAVLNVHQNMWTGKMSVTIHDPNKPEQEELSPATLLGRSGGVLLVLSPAVDKKAS